MNQFIVPQFIDVEDRILGPITVRQFVLLVTGGIIIFLVFRFGSIISFILTSLVVGGIVLLFGFLKVNGAHFHLFLLNVLTSFKKPSLRIWNKNLSNEEIWTLLKQPRVETLEPVAKHKTLVSSSRLAELSLIVDTHGRYKGEE